MEDDMMKLGDTGLTIPSFALGTWAMGGGESWGPSDDDLSIKTIHRSLEMGLNFIDTAPAYGNGASELLLGKALKGRRDRCVLATKCGLIWGDKDTGAVHKSRDGVTVRRNLSKLSIIEQTEESLRRLQTDYIDLLLSHWPSIEPFNTPIEETVEAFELLKQQGKIRAYGACNLSLDQLKEYERYGNPALIQQRYSLLFRESEALASYAADRSIIFQAYSPLERGVLTGRPALGEPVVGSAKASVKWYQAEKQEAMQGLRDSLEELATVHRCSVSALVLAWTAASSKTMNVLFGARKVPHLEENAQALTLSLSESEWARINDLAKALI
jgi:methylglyoxal reductase